MTGTQSSITGNPAQVGQDTLQLIKLTHTRVYNIAIVILLHLLTKVTCDRVELFWCLAQHACCCLHQILVTGAVETIAPDVVFLIVLVRQAVHVGKIWHGLVVSGIKHTDL